MNVKLIIVAMSLLATSVLFTSCGKEEVEVIVDSSQPMGDFTSLRMGSIVEQNGTGSKGVVSLGEDDQNITFVKFSTDFMTVLATGTVTVYLSTSNEFKADPANGNPNIKLIGTVLKNGEQYIKIDSTVDSKYTHLILWCGSANIPFGYAELK